MAEENRFEVHRVKSIFYTILSDTCLNTACARRKYYDDKKIREILGELNTETNGTQD